jgi:hypothetical protein
MYSEKNFKSKKAFKDAVKAGEKIRLFAPGLGWAAVSAISTSPVVNGRDTVEGPHYPEPHRWYASVEMRDGFVVSVK